MADADLSWIPAATTLIGGGLSLYGGQQAARGAIASGDATLSASQRAAAAYRDAGARQSASEIIKARRLKEADDFAAAQYIQNAGQQVAASQRGAKEQNRQAELVASRARALAAASGAGASDVSVVNLIGRIKGEGAYNAQTVLYQGEEQARQMRMAAAAKKYQGLTAEEAGGLNAADIRARSEASAVAEESKGVAASEAGRIQAEAARLKGVTGALPAIGALAPAFGALATAGASLWSKYAVGKDPNTGVADNGDGADYYGTASSSTDAEIANYNAAAMADGSIAGGSVEAIDAAGVAADAADFEWLALLA